MGRLFVFLCLLFINFSLFHAVLAILTHSFMSTQPSCHDDEKLALIQFNQSFIINQSASSYEGAYPKSSSWKIEGNCCSWDGIKCDDKTGHVISLDLSSSFLFGSINSSSSLFRLVHLQSLNLGDNDFNYSQIPNAIGRFSISLKVLIANSSNFSGPIPPSLGKLSQLAFLDLGRNSFSGHIPSSLHKLTQLRYLRLSGNQLPGLIPSWLGNLTQLTVFRLAGNKLHGTFPQSLSKLMNLESLNLNSNSISGTVNFDVFFNMKSLHNLALGHNNLSLIMGQSSRNATLSKFICLELSGCNLTKFPDFIRYQSILEWLVLSDNNIHGKIPKWMWNTSVERLCSLSLDNNFLTGFDQPPKVLHWVRLSWFDLHSNMLQGPALFPQSFGAKSLYDISDNKLTGEISPLVCNFTSLSSLDLSDNNFSGVIPHCLGNFSDSLLMLRLSDNSFHGTIHVACTNTSHLRMIDFSYDQFQGKLPLSLATCMMLESLDLHHNQLVDVFPAWLCMLPGLKLLPLRRNGFYGVIEAPEKTSFPKLQVLDLSYNNFTGELPFGHNFMWNALNSINVNELTYMKTDIIVELASFFYNVPHYNSIRIMIKGSERSYAKILEEFAIIDLSSNKFSGEIAQSLGKLKALHSLNLSNNMLTGHIPSSLGNLSELESLDLSQNRLSGEIPWQLTQLTFLQSFDVSHNNLTGPIPQGNQLSTFEKNSFEDNPGLCGNPLSRKCQNLEALPPSHWSVQNNEDSESPIELDWKFALAGFISGLVVGVVLADIVITKRQEWLVNILRRRAPKRRKDIRGRC